MKKIVGILAAAAVLATSVFAADVSAGVRLEGSLFKYDGTTEGVTALTINHNNQFYHAPIAFSISDDKAGGTLKLTDLDKNDVVSRCWSIWFKPVDALKITVGEWTGNLNQEKIDWCNTDSGIGAEDGTYTVSLTPVDGLSIDVSAVPGFGKPWFKDSKSYKGDDEAIVADKDAKADDKKAAADRLTADKYESTTGTLGFLMHYGADFGTISAVFQGESNFKTLKFGAGYANNFDGLDFFVNVLGFYASEEFKKVRAEVWLAKSFDAVTFQTFIVGGYNLKGGYDASWWHVGQSGEAEKAFVGATAKLSYAMDGITPYLYFKSVNFLADPLTMEFKPGFTTKVGCCDIELAADITVAKKVTFDVPVNFKVVF